MEKRPSPLKLLGLGVVALAVAGLGYWWLKIHDFSVRQSIEAGVALLRDGGPWLYFTAFALLPAVGFPVSMFFLTAGPAFAQRLGVGGVIAATGVALLVNIAFSYWLARYALRPWLEGLIRRTKYKIPVVAAAEHAEITLILQITPGLPYFMKNFLLGLAEIRFGTCLGISWVVSMAYASGFIVFGDALLQGKAGLAVTGVSGLIVVMLAVHLLRRHYGKKRA